MNLTEKLDAEIRTLRERLSLLSEASLHINESLDFETVLQGVLDSARVLTHSKYGVMTLTDVTGRARDCVASGMTPEQSRQFWNMPDGLRFFAAMQKIREPLRLRDFHSHTREMGLPEFRPPIPVGDVLTFLAAPVRHRGESVGVIYLAEKEGGASFTQEDEDTLVMFASQAALVIANARRHRDEQKAKADLEAVINTSPVAVVVFDAATGKIESINREAARIRDFFAIESLSRDEILRALTVQRADGREVSMQKLPLIETLSAGEIVRAEEIVVSVPDGRSLTAIVNATPIRSDDGSVESFVVTVQDTTQLEDMERMRAEFLAMVSHELRAPLAAIKGSTTTALTDTVPARQAEMVQFLRIIDTQADQMNVLINDLLDVARIETGTLIVNPIPTVVTELLDQARNTFLSGWDRDNIHIELAPGLSLIMADAGRVVQVVVNLLTNAARNSPQDSPIRVTAVQEDDNVAISVIDKGKGVSPENLPHLFRRFPRRDSDPVPGYEAGASWGLSICKGIVEAHGGRIWAESDGLETGSRFNFTIPIAEDVGRVSSRLPVADTADARISADNNNTVLVVDDDPLTLRRVREALSRAGFVPVVTGDPAEALLFVDQHSPELVLMDLVLPGSDGIQLMQDIVRKVDIPVIILSAYGHEDAVVRAFDSGATDYIVKPFSPSELTARIRATLRKRTPLRKDVPSEPFVMGALQVDYARRRVTIGERALVLTRIEYLLIEELSVNAGRTVLHKDLLNRVWTRRRSDDRRPVHATVKNIRRKLGDDAKAPTYIFSERNVGYRLGTAE